MRSHPVGPRTGFQRVQGRWCSGPVSSAREVEGYCRCLGVVDDFLPSSTAPFSKTLSLTD